jgi:hydroxymethylpyrimidine pyrophosphatase-like HAD family hydrolase
MWFFQAVALDLDGTLAMGDRVTAEVLSALDEARRDRALLLVTGRDERDLDRVAPGLGSHFDVVVSENGAVVTLTRPPATTRLLHEPVEQAVDKALADRGVASVRGRVLVAIDGRDATPAVEAVAELGLDHQVVHNRGAAMILPAGITKGTGLAYALTALGLSPHNTLAVGDAENDLTLLRTAEVGVAVANAVPSLVEHADLVLDEPDGGGVVALLGGPVVAGSRRVWPRRRAVAIGSHDDGTPATVPGAQAGVLVTGGSGTGKSFLAGLLAERWMEAGYSVLVIDPEGDHRGLVGRPDTLLVDAEVGLPSPHELLGQLRLHTDNLVLDLSRLEEAQRLDYVHRLRPAIAAERSRRGVPHWVVYDEAHEQAWLEPAEQIAGGAGTCLVTWRPELLDPGVTEDTDVVIALESPEVPAAGGDRRRSLRATLRTRDGVRPFVVGPRASHHVRHQQKYARAELPPDRCFYFRDQDRVGPTAAAASLEQFHEQLQHADAETVEYHAMRGDFSRWVAGTLADHALAHELGQIERDLVTRHAGAVEHARQQIRTAVLERYLRADPRSEGADPASAHRGLTEPPPSDEAHPDRAWLVE